MEYNELKHWGIKGQKWGERRFQNLDGTLTAAGKDRYSDDFDGGESVRPRMSTPSGPFGHAATKNGVIAVNRLMQMGIVGGLTFGGAAIARGTGKKALGAALATVGTLGVTALGASMMNDFGRNDASDSMNHSELYHWGIKGMKWGERRYQNADGTLTPAGKKRYDRDIAENNAKKKDNRIVIDGPDASRWVKEDTKRAKGVVDSSKDMVRELENVNRSTKSKNNKQKMDLSNMSDKEMRDRINRAMLEKQYNDMFAPQKESRGREMVSKTLETAGTVLAIGS